MLRKSAENAGTSGAYTKRIAALRGYCSDRSGRSETSFSEPVIFSGTTDLYLVLGTWDIGKPCKKVIFRFDEMQKEELIRDDMELPKRKILPEEAVTEEHIRRILRAYRYRLKEIGYNEKITCLFSKQDGENIRFCQADTDRSDRQRHS